MPLRGRRVRVLGPAQQLGIGLVPRDLRQVERLLPCLRELAPARIHLVIDAADAPISAHGLSRLLQTCGASLRLDIVGVRAGAGWLACRRGFGHGRRVVDFACQRRRAGSLATRASAAGRPVATSGLRHRQTQSMRGNRMRPRGQWVPGRMQRISRPNGCANASQGRSLVSTGIPNSLALARQARSPIDPALLCHSGEKRQPEVSSESKILIGTL